MSCCGFPGGGAFNPAEFTAAFPSAFWYHTFIPANVANDGQAGMLGETNFAASPNNVEWLRQNFDQNEETVQWASAYWCAPFNWKKTALKLWAYWFTQSASHGVANDFEWHIKSLSDGASMTFNQTYTPNNGTDLAINVLYITDVLTYTPLTAGTLTVRDFFHIMFRRGNDAASGATGVVGYQIAWEVDPTIAVP